MKPITLSILVLALAPATLDCGGETSGGAAPPLGQYDLPLGWEGSALLSGLTQAACGGLSASAEPESVDARLGGATLHVDYHHARFRCAQSVQAFVRYGATQADVLVQPIDMNPENVTRCGCTYEIGVDIDGSHGNGVAVYRRSDHVGNVDPTPTLVGTASAAAR